MSGREASFALGTRRPGPMLTAIMIANVAFYVLELVLMRMGVPIERWLFLRPADVFENGAVWQLLSYPLLHAPQDVMHLVFNLITLYFFAAPLERYWGPRRFLIGYGVFALSGGLFTLLVALLSVTPVLSWLLPQFWTGAHVGASGAAVGYLIAFGLEFAEQEMNFFVLGRMKVKTFVLVMVAIEVLVALSFSQTSSTSHFGGMLGALIFVKGLWRPGRWLDIFRRGRLERRKREIERELRVIDGGKKDDLPN